MIMIPDCIIRIHQKLVKKYPILKNIKIMAINHDERQLHHCFGLCEFSTNLKYIKDIPNLKIIEYQPTQIKIELEHKMTLDCLIFTFIHECAHAITLITISKVKGQWIRDDDHSDQFYKNLAELLKYLETEDIFQLNATSNGSKYSTRNLRRYDHFDATQNSLPIGKYLVIV